MFIYFGLWDLCNLFLCMYSRLNAQKKQHFMQFDFFIINFLYQQKKIGETYFIFEWNVKKLRNQFQLKKQQSGWKNQDN
jgi:hypothetical protein